MVGSEISEEAQREIQRIIDNLSMGTDPDKREEIQRIRDVCQKGGMNTSNPVKADLLVENREGSLYLFDLKTAKPNISNFKDFKRSC